MIENVPVPRVVAKTRMTFNLPSSEEMALIENLAELACKMPHYDKILKGGGKGALVLLLLTAREYDIPPMQALNGGLRNMDGTIEMSTPLISGKIRQHGHSVSVLFGQDEKLGQYCKVIGKRRDNGDTMEIVYSLAHAQQAGLASKDNWKKHPKDMCYARALRRLASMLFADVLGGAYADGEISETKQVENVIEECEQKPFEINAQKLHEFEQLWIAKHENSAEKAHQARINDEDAYWDQFQKFCVEVENGTHKDV